MVKQGLSPDEAASRFYVLDHHGLITQKVRSAANAGMLLLRSWACRACKLASAY